MSELLGRFSCFIFRCPPNQEMCMCGRCGRTKHLWVKLPHEESEDFEFCGKSARGDMVYTEMVRQYFTCSRCGEKSSMTIRRMVHQ